MTRAPLTVRIATWIARHRWLVVLLWFAATLGTLGASFAAGGINTIDVDEDPNGPRLESELAYEVLGLLPASMTLLGDWNWWLPRWLGWLPHVTIEGASGEPEELDVPEAPAAAQSAAPADAPARA